MGTRADLYVGRGPEAEWLGSIAYDGHPYPENIGDRILQASTEVEFRAAAAARLKACDHATRPEQGWPWPWTDSRTTDYAYAFEHGYTWASSFGHAWFRPAFEPEPESEERTAVFPDMTARQNVRWDRGSGLMIVRLPGGPE